jgi:hypothetical protein
MPIVIYLYLTIVYERDNNFISQSEDILKL